MPVRASMISTAWRRVGAFTLLTFVATQYGCHRPVQLAGTPFDPDRVVEYKLYPGDLLDVRYPSDSTLDQSVRVRSDGIISLPYTGAVQAAGRSPEDVQAELNERVSEFLKTPNVTVIVSEESGRRFFVGGEVQRPGSFELRPNVTLVQALNEAGGLSLAGNPHEVLVLRYQDGVRPHLLMVDVPRILAGKDADVMLDPYDVIHATPTDIALVGRFVDQYINAIIPRAASFPFQTNVNAQNVRVSDNQSGVVGSR